ncbi:MAG: tetratricopeptide repeat protein [Deltaproteobacteria bacterium]|nr:tetratricopeptide repeat protein [Deltaproteobacteria bacterium]
MRRKSIIATIVSLFFTAMLLNACSDESTSLSFPKSEPPIILFQGFKIPKFPTARGQLNYAKSGFPSSEEKKAAFKIMFQIFPEARVECGNAALNLAYMNLGYDYRFAKKLDYYNAIKAYHDVIKNFKEYPVILVKAYWYLGWIHCDLLKEKELGIQYFQHIVKTYPDIKTGISSPVPWVSLVYPLAIKGNLPAKDKTKKQWASLALLEIIRHGRDKNQVFTAFDTLWKNYPDSVPAGLAIKLLLGNKQYAGKALPYIKKYLNLNVANIYLAREIKDLAKEY